MSVTQLRSKQAHCNCPVAGPRRLIEAALWRRPAAAPFREAENDSTRVLFISIAWRQTRTPSLIFGKI